MVYNIKTILVLIMLMSHSLCLENIIGEYNELTHTLKIGNQIYYISLNTTIPKELAAEENLKITRSKLWFNIILSLIITLFAGAMSGLTVGYLSIDELILELKESTGTEQDKEIAKKIKPIISNHHWLLVTLLLCNSFACETLPLILDNIVPEIMAVIISVILLLLFGEIIPQALCTGPRQYTIASYLSTLTISLMYITFPISYPIGLLMDIIIGKHIKTRFNNQDLRQLIYLHTENILKQKIKDEDDNNNNNYNELDDGFGLTEKQVNVIEGAIDIQKKKVSEIMIPISQVKMLNYNEPITSNIIKQIKDWGRSRIPIYNNNRNKIMGILRVKQLINVDLSKNKSICQLFGKDVLNQPLIISKNMLALNLLDEFKKGKSHMAIIINDVKHDKELYYLNQYNNTFEINTNILGIITLEDIIENIININILDEDDYIKAKAKKKYNNYNNIHTKEVCNTLISEKADKIKSILDTSTTEPKDMDYTSNYTLLQ